MLELGLFFGTPCHTDPGARLVHPVMTVRNEPGPGTVERGYRKSAILAYPPETLLIAPFLPAITLELGIRTHVLRKPVIIKEPRMIVLAHMLFP